MIDLSRLSALLPAWWPQRVEPEAAPAGAASAGDRFERIGRTPISVKLTPAVRAMPPLTASDARHLELADGLVTRGHGVLVGELVLREVASARPMFAGTSAAQAVLVTARLGQRSEVSFALDLPTREAERRLARGRVDGERHVRVAIEGDFAREGEGFEERGVARGCRVAEADVRPRYFSVGDPIHASGRVSRVFQTGNEHGIPLGRYLDLDAPILVDGEEVDALYLPNADGVTLQQHVEVDAVLRHGRFTEVGAAVHYVELGELRGLHREGDPPRRLDVETLESISDVGGWRVSGLGTLGGVLEVSGDEAALITSAWGPARKSFVLEVPPELSVRPLSGRRVAVHGLITHDSPKGTITVDRVTPLEAPRVFAEREALTLRGMVRHGYVDGRAVPMLALAEPILIADRDGARRVQELRLDVPPSAALESGSKLEVDARLRRYTHRYQDEDLEGVALDVKALRHPVDMDAFHVDVESLTQDFPFRTTPRLRVEVPSQA